MASLKEVKNRIASVKSTRKITSAMKMVASSKLHHAQQAIEQMCPYEHRLGRIMATFVSSLDGDISSPYAVEREVRRVALVVFTSNSSLCGGFNGNVIKMLRSTLHDYEQRGIQVVKVYPIGKKAADALRKLGSEPADYSAVLDHPAYDPVAAIAQEIMDLFSAEEIDAAEIIYHHFKSSATQILRKEQFLPVVLKTDEGSAADASNYIVEPSAQHLVSKLIPRALHLQVYTALLDSLASEHAARVIAMQVATDNADELLSELTLQYNKTRQQAITAELLDIVGGSMQ